MYPKPKLKRIDRCTALKLNEVVPLKLPADISFLN